MGRLVLVAGKVDKAREKFTQSRLLGDFKANAAKSTAVAFGRNKLLAGGYLPLRFTLSSILKSCISQTSFVI